MHEQKLKIVCLLRLDANQGLCTWELTSSSAILVVGNVQILQSRFITYYNCTLAEHPKAGDADA